MSVKLKRYHTLLEGIEAERAHEESWYLKLSQAKSKKEKQEAGILIPKASVKKILSTIGNKPEVLFSLDSSEIRHRFRVGGGCVLYLNDEGTYKVRGTVSFIKRQEIGIYFTDDDSIYEHVIIGLAYSIELLYDERPYTVMKDAIHHILTTKDHRLSELRDGIDSNSSFPETRDDVIPIDKGLISDLNPSQQQAIETSINAGSISIIHGPPGTGKTTTLSTLIQVLATQGKKVLACASSNNATDLLSVRVAEKGINVLRIGNLSRIDDTINHLTLDGKIRNHKEWSNVKKIKIEAEDARKKANSFKRSFGPDQRMERNRLRAESKKLRAWARDLEKKIVGDIIDQAQVVSSTLIGISTNITKDLRFDTVVIDEASQALEPECWNAMALANHVILVGDHMQLPPTVKSPKAKDLKLGTTLLDLLIQNLKHSSLLSVQYRMNDLILGWPNEQFYQGKLQSHGSVANHLLHENDFPIEYIDTSGCGFEEEMEERTLSKYNTGEYLILREHFLQHMEHYFGSSIAFISPYAAQVRYIYQQVQEDTDLSTYDITVNSIDGFQGQECDIVYLSLVRNNHLCEIGFLADFRRLNVAITRARKKLIIVADTATLSGNETYISFFDYIEAKGLYRSAWEYMA